MHTRTIMFRKELPTTPTSKFDERVIRLFNAKQDDYKETVRAAEKLYKLSKTFEEDPKGYECPKRGRLCLKTRPAKEISVGEEGYEYIGLIGADSAMEDCSFILSIYVPTHVTVDLISVDEEGDRIIATYKPNDCRSKSIEEILRESKTLPTFQRENELLDMSRSVVCFERLYCDDTTTITEANGVEYTRVRLIEPFIDLTSLSGTHCLLRFSEHCRVFIDYLEVPDKELLEEIGYDEYDKHLFFSEFIPHDGVLIIMEAFSYSIITKEFVHKLFDR